MTVSRFISKLHRGIMFLPMFVALLVASWRGKRPPLRRRPQPWGQGISVLIPENGTPDLLGPTLQHAAAAIEVLDEPAEIVVMVNGASAALYADLQQAYPQVVWRFADRALGFNGAVEAGLQAVRQPAVYLLNSDMRIAVDALQQLLPYRQPWVFALASQIFFADSQRRREETGWSDYYVDGIRTVTYEKDPAQRQMARGSLYAGGGSSLFRTALLREYVRDSRCYSPFYWEDADWGVRAWAEGLECLFVPASTAVHEHRGTIKRRFSDAEIDRIVNRNALLFELRHHFTPLGGVRAIAHLAAQVSDTRQELGGIRTAHRLATVRGRSNAAMRSGFLFPHIINKYYGARWRADKPTLLWVTPFIVCPPSHGGARRITELARRLGAHVNLVLLSDEALTYEKIDEQQFAPFQAVHLVQARWDEADQPAQDLPTRMQVHAPAVLRSELRRLQQQYAIDLVQVEFMETTRLVEERIGQTKFVASLHDVYFDGGEHDAMQLDVLRHYDALVTCSDEDTALLPDMRCSVVANGAVDRYAQSEASPSDKKVLFMGPFRYQPNHAGILLFLTQVWPALRQHHPDATLVILGGAESAEARFQHPALQQAGVQLISEFVDPAPLLAACALTINPQQEIRGSALKVAEALLARRICVSTQHGARGFDKLATGALRVCLDWQQMLEELVLLLGDDARRHTLEQSSEQVRNALSWDGKAQQLLGLYQQLLPGRFKQENSLES